MRQERWVRSVQRDPRVQWVLPVLMALLARSAPLDHPGPLAPPARLVRWALWVRRVPRVQWVPRAHLAHLAQRAPQAQRVRKEPKGRLAPPGSRVPPARPEQARLASTAQIDSRTAAMAR